MPRKTKKADVDWLSIAQSARPLLLVAIDILLHTKKLGPYSTALRLLSLAIDKMIPETDLSAKVTAIRRTQEQLPALGKAKPAKRRAVLSKLKTQVTEL